MIDIRDGTAPLDHLNLRNAEYFLVICLGYERSHCWRDVSLEIVNGFFGSGTLNNDCNAKRRDELF